ncbi:MAG: GTP pyrophosphokinase family protein [Termitinemataceae bacterium]|nr:MAG: GTP pyrophosphokinase family protein [Termitinemataceae bacterium]
MDKFSLDSFFNLSQKIGDNLFQMLEPLRKLMSYYRCALMEVETRFNVLNEELSITHERNPIEHIKTRIKTPDSIRKKMGKLQLPLTVDAIEKNIYDVAGIRIICQFINDIFVLADFLLTQDGIKLLEKKDYITHPKESGYRSLHLIIEVPIFLHNDKRFVKVEVQLRTIAMDFWASLEHKLHYKKDMDKELEKIVSDELKKCAEESIRLDLKMQDIQDRIEKRK